jgi:hypothetical protein
MTALATLIVLAMADQLWGIAFHRDYLLAWSPVSRQQVRIPLELLEDEAREGDLRLMLLGLVVMHGLWFEGDAPSDYPRNRMN